MGWTSAVAGSLTASVTSNAALFIRDERADSSAITRLFATYPTNVRLTELFRSGGEPAPPNSRQRFQVFCPTASGHFAARRQGFTNTTRTIASAARQGLRFKSRTSQGTCVGGRVMSGMTSVVIVWVAGAPAKTRQVSRPSAFPSMDSGMVVAIVSVPKLTEAVPTYV